MSAPARVERCELTELEVASCAHCTGRTGDLGERQLRELAAADMRGGDVELGPLLVALYAGRCAACGDPFDVGADIARTLDSRDYVGPCCHAGREPDREGRP